MEVNPIRQFFLYFKNELYTIIICTTWYISASLKNTLAKEFLAEKPLPVTLSFLECGFVVLYTFFTLKFRFLGSFSTATTINNPFVVPSWAVCFTVFPLCLSNVFAHTFTQVSLKYIAVSFTHTIKSLSPVITMILSYILIPGSSFSIPMTLSVIPLVLGVLLSSAVEINFNFIGASTAFLSTLFFCYQNIYSKIIIDNKKLDHYNLLIYNNCGGMIILFVLSFVTEWSMVADFTGAHLVELDVHSFFLIIGIGFFHFLQNITAFSFLSTVNALTYSIANTFKRVFVIITSILYFGNEVTPLNYLGIVLACVGVLLYNKANSQHREKITVIN